MSWVVEMTGYDPVAEEVSTRRFAMGPGLSLPDAPYIPGGMKLWASPSQKVDVTREGGVQLSADAGQVVIQNAPPDAQSAGPLDYTVKWAWRTATCYYVQSTWGGRVMVGQGFLQQPVSDLEAAELRFPLRDPRFALNVPLQSTKYAGSNVDGDGVEGGADLKGKPKPILYGVVSNIPGVQVNAQKLIWQVSDAPVSVICVRDGGISLSTGTVRASLATLLSNVPLSGHYDTYAGVEGTFVRLGSSPVFKVTMDAQEGAAEANRTHAQIWKRLRTERCDTDAGEIDAASVSSTDALDGHEVGFWWADETTRLAAVNEVLTSLSGFELLDYEGEWAISKLVQPTGAPDFELIKMDPTATLKANTRPILSLGFARPNYAADGVPPYRVNIRWGRNYTVMAPADFAGGANPRLKEKFSQDRRVETVTNTAIWDPDTKTGPWVDAPEMTVDVNYQPGPDGQTCPHAVVEANRILTLYSGLRGQYQTSFNAKPTDRLLPGQVVSLRHPQMDLQDAPRFRVLQAAPVIGANGLLQINLVAGLQGSPYSSLGEPGTLLDFSDPANSGHIPGRAL